METRGPGWHTSDPGRTFAHCSFFGSPKLPMNLKSVIICTALSLGLALIATLGFPSNSTAAKVADACERLEVLAFEMGGSPELQSAVGDLRDANKYLFVEGSIQSLLQILSTGSSVAALILCIWISKSSKPASNPTRYGVLRLYSLRS